MDPNYLYRRRDVSLVRAAIALIYMDMYHSHVEAATVPGFTIVAE